MSEHRYRQMVADLAAAGHAQHRPKSDIREEIVHRVHAASAASEHWAAEVLARWEREGAERDYERAHTELNTTTYIRADGTRVKKTTSYSTPRRTTESGQVVFIQSTFWDYERLPFINKRNELAAQAARIDDAVAAFDRVLEAWARHPDCRTAREAWEADGHTTTEIDLAA